MRPFTYKRIDEVDKVRAAVGPDRMPPPMAATQFLAGGAAVTMSVTALTLHLLLSRVGGSTQ